VWDAVQRQIQESHGLEAKTLFEWLQREYPGRYSDGQIRTLQRRIKLWRVTEGPALANAPETGEIRVHTGSGNTPSKPGVPITAEREGSRYQTLTNATGDAVFTGLQPSLPRKKFTRVVSSLPFPI
jgi:hypothetical protein